MVQQWSKRVRSPCSALPTVRSNDTLAWGWRYPSLDFIKTAITGDDNEEPIDLRIGDHIDLSVNGEHQSVTVMNQRTGVSVQKTLAIGGEALCRSNVAWAVGRTDDNDPATFNEGNFNFTNIMASTADEGSVGLAGAVPVRNTTSVQCNLDTGTAANLNCASS